MKAYYKLKSEGVLSEKIEFSDRIKRLPPYIFADLEKLILEKKQAGVKIISLSIGDPDLPPPEFVLDAFRREVVKPENHKYSFSQGEPDFRKAVSEWYKIRFNVELDPDKEVICLIGSKEGIANVTRAFVNSGESIIVPDPAYPVYANGSTVLNDCKVISLPLLEENGFKPDFNAITDAKSQLMFLNYPNNPTGETADTGFLKEAIDFAKDNELILCYDNAYSEITFDGYDAPSVLQVKGAYDVALEFHSCSKTFNMTGDRVAFAVGNQKLIEGLKKVKTQIDSGPPIYVQKVAAAALSSYKKGKKPAFLQKNLEIYENRRDVLIEGLKKTSLKVQKPKATFYVWAKWPGKSIDSAKKLLNAGVIVTPGSAFGYYGEGYLRFALTTSKEAIAEACKRIMNVFS